MQTHVSVLLLLDAPQMKMQKSCPLLVKPIEVQLWQDYEQLGNEHFGSSVEGLFLYGDNAGGVGFGDGDGYGVGVGYGDGYGVGGG